MHHLIGLIENILLRYLLEHLLISLQMLNRYIILGVLINQVNLYPNLRLTPAPHEGIFGWIKPIVLSKKELRLDLVRFYVALDEIDADCVGSRFHQLPQLLLIEQLVSLVVQVLYYRYLLTCALLYREQSWGL